MFKIPLFTTGRRFRIATCILLTFIRAASLATCFGIGPASQLFILATNLRARHDAADLEGSNWPGDPGIPRVAGGVFGFALARIFSCESLSVTAEESVVLTS